MLAGRSVALDPRRHAVRGDLADARLADRVFAPHYAMPMPIALVADSPLRAMAAADAEVLATLDRGDLFEALEFAGDHAWGVVPGKGLVGYVPLAAVGRGRS